ncbi:MAG TPA: 4-coumarate--CoA ligase family protein [Pyrinomonadaceae bacterium]|jgi:acyl-CoA synthetase (AMP-forming)/AMP-acid ligase II|nr:4-coumarate--CoA ligase family protein [Pyrinomonadaceae bacterium]
MIFRSPFPDVPVPDVPLTEFVFGQAGRFADKPALVDGVSGRVTTYAQLVEAIRRTAAGLARRGFRKGDVLALLSPNAPEYAVAFHAAASLGGIVTPINPLYTAEEVLRQIKDARAKYLVTTPQLLGGVRAVARGAGVEEMFVFGEAEGACAFASLSDGGPEPDGGAESDGVKAEDGSSVARVSIEPREDLIVLPYSSGTTGVCKGVMLTHRNLVANLSQLRGAGYEWEGDTLICVLPMFHIYGLVAILNYGLWCGSTIVTLPRFDFEQVLRTMQDYRVSLAHLVPPIVLALAKHPAVDSYDLSSLKMIFSGAAPLGAELSQECSARLGCDIVQGYGMTETSPATHVSTPRRNKPGSVGVCVPNTECKLVSVEAGEELGTGQRGEICVRGPQVMKGYLNCPEATAQTIDADGWLHTGDIGYADPEGFFYVVDRAKELIKFKGLQVAPAELEALLLTHPSVADAAVIPSADEEAGEVPKAFVVVKEGHALTEVEVLSFVAAHVAPFKKVRRVEFVAQIPKSPSGKILRRLLVERERERAG